MRARSLVILRLSAILLSLATTLLVHAQQTTATLHGSVLNSVTRQPVARALVTLDQDGQAVLTDNEGRFTFDSVPAGPGSLAVRRPGYGDESGNSNAVRASVTLPSAGDISLELVPQSAITGELLLPGDEPPDSLQLQLLHREIQNGRGHWSIYRSIEAASDGHFRFGGLPAGAYLVHVGASLDPLPARPPSGAAVLRSGYVPAFYSNARDIAAAGVITLTAGQQADIKMELTREPFYPVAIPVANVEEARGIGFEIASDSFLGIAARFSNEDGMVHTDLPTGHYVLEAHGFGSRGVAGQREFDVNGAAATHPAAITLLPISRIPVSVHAELTHSSLSVSGTSGTLTAANQISLDLQKLGDGAGTHGQRPSLEDDPGSSASGISQIVGATAGKYWVNARSNIGYIASMTSGGVDLLDSPLTVGSDGSASAINVALRDDTGTVSASIASSLLAASQAGQPSIRVQMIPLSGPALACADERSLFLGEDGTTTFANLPPGSYLAVASTSHRQIEYRNPTVMAGLTGRGQTVTVEPGGTAHVTIDSLFDSSAALSPGAP